MSPIPINLAVEDDLSEWVLKGSHRLCKSRILYRNHVWTKWIWVSSEDGERLEYGGKRDTVRLAHGS